MKIKTEKVKRQYILEQAILEEISIMRHLFTEARFKWEPEEGDLPPTLTFDEYLLELNTLRTEIVGRLDNLLKSVTLSYNEVGKEDEESN